MGLTASSTPPPALQQPASFGPHPVAPFPEEIVRGEHCLKASSGDWQGPKASWRGQHSVPVATTLKASPSAGWSRDSRDPKDFPKPTLPITCRRTPDMKLEGTTALPSTSDTKLFKILNSRGCCRQRQSHALGNRDSSVWRHCPSTTDHAEVVSGALCNAFGVRQGGQRL